MGSALSRMDIVERGIAAHDDSVRFTQRWIPVGGNVDGYLFENFPISSYPFFKR